MSHPAVYIATAVVVGVAALIAFLVTKSDEKNRPHSYGRSAPKRRPSPPPSPPPPSSVRQRAPPPEKRVSSPSENSTSASSQRRTCKNCGNSPYVKVLPCNHESLCRGCFTEYLETNDTCADCNGRIDSVSPLIPPFGKCTSCRKFTKLLKFLPCSHSLSVCIRCFERQNTSHKKCPECGQPIRDYEPKCNTLGVCEVCNEFTHFAMFQPCGHGSFCMEHARMYLDKAQECNVCEWRVSEVA